MGVLSGLKTLLETGQPDASEQRCPGRVLELRAACGPPVQHSSRSWSWPPVRLRRPRRASPSSTATMRRGSVAQPGGTLYGQRLALSWGSRARKLVRYDDVHYPYRIKLPIFIRAGGRAFTIEVPPTWHQPAGDGLGQPRRCASPRSPAACASCPVPAATS